MIFRKFTMILLDVPRINYLFIFFANSLLNFSREFVINSVSGPLIHYLLHLNTMNSLSILRTQNEFTFYLANQLWFYFLFHEFAIYFAKKQWIHYLCRYYTMKSLSVSQIHYLFGDFNIFLANSLWIYWVSHNSLWIFANSLWIYY